MYEDRMMLIRAATAAGVRVRNMAGQDMYRLTAEQSDDALPTTLWNPYTNEADLDEIITALNILVDDAFLCAECYMPNEKWRLVGWQGGARARAEAILKLAAEYGELMK